MKKFLIGLLVFILLIIVAATQFGIQIGNVRIGKQMDLKIKQSINFEESNFYNVYYSSNKLTVLNLWATWCVPCVEEIPDLNAIKNNFKDDSLNFISLSVDTDSVRLVKFLNKDKFKFTDVTMTNLKYRNAILNTLQGKKAAAFIPSQSVPITYLIKNKKVVAKIDGTIDKQELIALIEKNK